MPKSTKKKSSSSTPVKQTKSKEFEKSIIKDMESSKLRLKPWVLQLIGAVFVILGIVFIAYPLLSDRVNIRLPQVFNRDDTVSQDQDENESDDDDDADADENAEDKEAEDDENGSIAGGTSTRRDEASSATGISKAAETSVAISQTGRWIATDYEFNDIGKGSYQVKLGDTLWEISEAVYGDGSLWVNILQTNSSNIGFLADGSQALILPGQFLTLN